MLDSGFLEFNLGYSEMMNLTIGQSVSESFSAGGHRWKIKCLKTWVPLRDKKIHLIPLFLVASVSFLVSVPQSPPQSCCSPVQKVAAAATAVRRREELRVRRREQAHLRRGMPSVGCAGADARAPRPRLHT
ncbi:unnamed protein product [Urochloa humidicola]